LAQGFAGLEDLTHMREIRLKQLLMNMSGEINVNNDRYGTAPIRFRLYYSGMAIAAMLDRFDPDWKEAIFESGVSLTDLASKALEPQPGELKSALAKVQSGPEYEELVIAKRQLEVDGQADTAAMVDAIRHGPNTMLEIDYSGLDDVKSGIAFTPFGVRAVDNNRTIYTLVPIRARIGSDDFEFSHSSPTDTLEDRLNQKFQFQLAEKIDAGELTKILAASSKGPDDSFNGLDVVLGGVTLKAKRAIIKHQGDVILVLFVKSD
jgi:hypothetical protein